MTFEATPQQQLILDYNSHCVIIANPGSGKTFVVSEKIKRILPTLPFYKGIIGISFTNKSSEELRRRCLNHNLDKKSSFFGTIDKFFCAEIIIPFCKQIFNYNPQEIKYESCSYLDEEQKQCINTALIDKNIDKIIALLSTLFSKGILLIETFGILALYCLQKSIACQNYVKARYTHVFIDEYQDTGFFQHRFFMQLISLGLIGVAVGDLNQSIYGFAGRSAEFLKHLSNNELFKKFYLTENKRCHPSIVNYAFTFLGVERTNADGDDKRVYFKRVSGDEIAIASWINSVIDIYKVNFCIPSNKDVGILVKNNRTASYINDNLITKHKYVIDTPLDSVNDAKCHFYRDILIYSLSNIITSFDITDIHFSKQKNILVLSQIREQIKKIKQKISECGPVDEIFEHIDQLDGNFDDIEGLSDAKSKLREVLNNSSMRNSYIPPQSDEVQIMTLHKSKGLEFSLVFHLDLYEYILPAKIPDGYISIEQCKNLHYVGITRAKECVILCSSTRRNNATRLLTAKDSEFLTSNSSLNLLRTSL